MRLRCEKCGGEVSVKLKTLEASGLGPQEGRMTQSGEPDSAWCPCPFCNHTRHGNLYYMVPVDVARSVHNPQSARNP